MHPLSTPRQIMHEKNHLKCEDESGLSSNPPQNSNKFQRDWVRHCLDDRRRFKYLCPVKPERAVEIFRTEVDAEILGEIFEALEFGVARAPTPDTDSKICEAPPIGRVLGWLLALPQCGCFSMSAAFLTGRQRQALTSVVSWLEQQALDEAVVRKELSAKLLPSADASSEDIMEKVTKYYSGLII